MGMVAIGPFAVPNMVFAALMAFITFTLLVSVATRRVDQRLERWSTLALISGLVVARAVYVVLHWATFSASPLRGLMLWQGGFEWISGAIAAIISTLFVTLTWRSRAVAIAILGVSMMVWMAAGAILNNSKVDVLLPDVVLRDLKGRDVALHSYATGPVVINLWATWCPPCRRELPAMIAQAHASPDVPFLFVNQAEDLDVVQAYLKHEMLTLEYVLLDTHSELARELHTVGIPITLFFYDGIMTSMHAGEISPEALRQKTLALLKK